MIIMFLTGGFCMVLAYASWIHGTAVQIEVPENVKLIRRFGWGTEIIGKYATHNVFHFPIPTPVIVNDKRLKIGSVLFKLKTGGHHTIVSTVNINDGSKLLQSYPNVNLSGNVDLKRFDVPAHPEVFLGIDIVVHVDFTPDVDALTDVDHKITFEAAGCDFIQ
jgi:hypothetical protein